MPLYIYIQLHIFYSPIEVSQPPSRVVTTPTFQMRNLILRCSNLPEVIQVVLCLGFESKAFQPAWPTCPHHTSESQALCLCLHNLPHMTFRGEQGPALNHGEGSGSGLNFWWRLWHMAAFAPPYAHSHHTTLLPGKVPCESKHHYNFKHWPLSILPL